MSHYLESISVFGIAGAHPGGFTLSEKIIGREEDWREKEVLDAGCGTGQTASYLAKAYGANVTGIDISPVMIEKAKDRMKKETSSVKLLKGDIQALPFPDQTFDYVLSESVVVFTNIAESLKEFRRVLKPNGTLIGIEMTREPLLTLQEIDRVKSFYGIRDLPDESRWESYLKEAGFSGISFMNNRETLPSNQEDVRSAVEFQLSDEVSPDMFDILYEHETITKLVYPRLSYRIFRSSREE